LAIPKNAFSWCNSLAVAFVPRGVLLFPIAIRPDRNTVDA
jgi:hypothetical protein